MKKAIRLFFLSFAVFFTACQSSKNLQREMQGSNHELFYDLTTPKYLGEIGKTVYLNFIDYSNLNAYTIVKKKGTLVIPLLLVNFTNEKFNITLGERSLTQTYREFLTDALLAECNRSACFNLEEVVSGELPDSVYSLDIKIVQNETNARIIASNILLILPVNSGTDSFSAPNFRINPASSSLGVSARLMQGGVCRWEKTYTASLELPQPRKGIDNLLFASDACLNTMTECLSMTTKQIVENISRDLHLLMLAER